MVTVIKISGHELSDHQLLTDFAETIANYGQPVIVVHGGGKEISELQTKLGIEPRYLDGVRITDADSLSVVEMVLCGIINKRLVRYLLAAGVDALGLSGIDRGLIRARKMQHATTDMGFTGTVSDVNSAVLQDLLNQGITPVVAPVCLGEDSSLNVNADHVAGAIANAITAEKVIFISNVEGVLIDGERVDKLTAQEVESYIADGTIYGGMIPKVHTALETLESGVEQAVITNLIGLKTHGGTVFVQSQ